MFLDLYEKQGENAADEYHTVETNYNEMNYQKEVRAEQKAAQQAQEAKQRELDENKAKLANFQSLLATATIATTTAENAFNANTDDELTVGL
jgi:hypothetical protein